MTAASTPSPLIGTWRLESFEMRDEEGHIAYPFGRESIGFITYTSDGRMSVQFGSAHRSDLRYDDWLGATTAEIDQAARAYFAYCGTYEVRGNEVIHHIQASLMPNWIGASNSGSGRWTETHSRSRRRRCDSTVARKSRPSCGSGVNRRLQEAA